MERTWTQITQFAAQSPTGDTIPGPRADRRDPGVELPKLEQDDPGVGGRVMVDERGVYLEPELDD